MTRINIGTRGSKLALVQANQVKELLANVCFMDKQMINIVPITTSGDLACDQNLATIGGKGLFTKELEEALLGGQIDLAVHSMKDLPAKISEGLELSAVLEREDCRDALIGKYSNIKELPRNATVGSSSARRKSLLLNMRPDLEVVNFRGNITTRLEKLANGRVDASLLAVAGLKRIGAAASSYHIIDTDEMLPAACQGAIAIETAQNNLKVKELVSQLNHYESSICTIAERAFLEALDAGCNKPVAALAVLQGQVLKFDGLIASLDGQAILRTQRMGLIQDAYMIGQDAGQELVQRAGKNFY